MAKDRLYINKPDRAIIDSWREKKILGLDDNTINTKEIFLIAAALGINEPKDLTSKEGYVLSSYITTEDKSLLSCILLGKVLKAGEDIDKYTNIDKVYEEAERCATSGISSFDKIVKDSNYDNDIIEKRLLTKLDLLYQANLGGKNE